MTRQDSSILFERIVKMAVIIAIIGMVTIFILSGKVVYVAILLLASMVSITGFLVFIELIDRFLFGRKGAGLFFLAEFFHLLFISLLFYPIGKISETAVLIYIFGLSTVVLALLAEGGYQMFKKI